MLKTFILIFALFPEILSGQQVKLVKDKENNEEYFVLQKDNSIRHGEYHKYGPDNSLLIKVWFKNGLK